MSNCKEADDFLPLVGHDVCSESRHLLQSCRRWHCAGCGWRLHRHDAVMSEHLSLTRSRST